jgi:predicted ArsR family transcriptional regulator
MPDEFSAIGALADPVRRRLYEYVAGQPDWVGREEAANGAGVPLHSARFHLDKLVDEGLLEVEHRRLTGRSGPGAGRPAKVYRRTPTEIAVSVPERSYALVGAVLAAAVDQSLQGAPLVETLREVARARGRAVGCAYAATGDELDRTAGALDDQGFEPCREGDEVSLRNCPFDTLARAHTSLVCGVNLDFVGGVIEGLECQSVEARLEPRPEHCCVRVAQASGSEPTTHIAKN